MVTSNLGRMVLQTAEANPDLLAIVNEDSMINYAQLAQAIQSFAARLQALGVTETSLVALDSGDINVVAPAVLAIALLGAGWVSSTTVPHLPDDLQPTHWLGTTPSADRPDSAMIDRAWYAGPAAKLPPEEEFDPEARFLVLPTSGTTGQPKIVILSHRQQAARAVATREDFVLRETVFCTLFRANAYPYVTRFLSAFVNGATVLNSRDPAMWREAGVNHLYGSVAQISEHLSTTVLPKKLPMVHVSGSKLSERLARHLLQSFDTVIDLYASTETNRSFKIVKTLDEGGNLVGRGVRLDSEVQIVDDEDREVPMGEIGYVRVRNDYLADGYYRNPEATAVSFRNGWFYTSDLGRFDDLDALHIVGRTRDVLNVGGRKVNALVIDEHFAALPSVADAMCFDVEDAAGGQALLSFIVPALGATLDDVAKEVQAQIVPALGVDRSPSRLIEVTEVPRAHDGGAQRHLCRALYEEKTREATQG